jgi:hypothetical protein
MTVKHNSEYTCDGCGSLTTVATDRKPDGWTVIHFFGGALGSRDPLHVCSRKCAADALRKTADEISPPVKLVSSGGPYR